MKKCKLLSLFLCIVICFSCTPKEKQKTEVAVQKNEVIQKSPELLKLESLLNYDDSTTEFVISNVNNEAKLILDNIKNNQEAFLSELLDILNNDTDNLFILADKKHYLLDTYQPEDLVSLEENSDYSISRNDLSLRIPVEQALREMSLGAKEDGITLLVSSSFRSYQYQKTIYERNVKTYGKATADRESAAPGTSQHQLGTAIDFGSITDDFAYTKAGKWLFANAQDYGFSLSFPEGYEPVTGYRYECWHYRYIGKKACEFQKKWFNNIQQYMMEFIFAYRY